MPTPMDATATAIAIDDVKQWRGQDVVDEQGDKLGKLDEVYYDTETDRPAFAYSPAGDGARRLAKH